jgi:hypothetical protein
VGSAKISWGGGDVAPAPRPPVSRGNSNDSECAQENCLTGGVHLKSLCPILCPIACKLGSIAACSSAASRSARTWG